MFILCLYAYTVIYVMHTTTLEDWSCFNFLFCILNFLSFIFFFTYYYILINFTFIFILHVFQNESEQMYIDFSFVLCS